MHEHPAREIARGYSWTECPRWHDGAFYFADMYSARIIRIGVDGAPEVYADFSGRQTLEGAPAVAAGFGFLSDGRLVVNSMHEGLVLVFDDGVFDVYADVRDLALGPINDMVVDADDRLYVTQIGYSLWKDEEPRTSHIIVVEPGASATHLAEGAGPLQAANGIAISADGRTVVTAEAPAKRLTAFDRAADGSLSRPRLFAQLDLLPDGICLDEQGAVWAAQPGGGGAIRVLDGGEITDKVTVDVERGGRTIACGLGGPDRRTLYICCGFEVWDFEKSVREGQGSIWTAEVPVSGTGTRP